MAATPVNDLTSDAGLHTTQVGEAGPRVVFCHGLFGQGKNWTQVAKELAADHRSVLVDMPNHGRSAWTDSVDYVAAADLVAASAWADDEPATLVGHSMGGKIAMALALRHPGLVERLCVVDVGPVTYGHTREFAGYIAAMRGLELDRLTSRTDADRQLEADIADPVVRGFLLQNLRRDGDGWRWQPNLAMLGDQLDRLAGWPGTELGGASYDSPVLWVGGERSDYIRDEHVSAMTALFPRTRRVTIRGAGHWVHSEQQETFVAVLRQFLAGP